MFLRRCGSNLVRPFLRLQHTTASAASSQSGDLTQKEPPKRPTEEEEEDIRRANQLQEQLSSAHEKNALSSTEDYRVPLKPFVKNLFLGQFDTTILAYPDIMDNDRYYLMMERCNKLEDHLMSKKDLLKLINKEGKISKDLLLPMKDLGLFGLLGKVEQGGQGLCLTESLKVLEQLSLNMSLSETFTAHNTFAYSALERCGTDAQKEKYLYLLLTGQWKGAVCMADDHCGSDPCSTTTAAEYNEYDDVYLLNGTKTWVTNATDANLFTVFANTKKKGHDGQLRDVLTAFLVERTSPGISVEEEDTHDRIGMKGLDLKRVTFKNTPVKPEQILKKPGEGLEVWGDSMAQNRVFAGARVFPLLKSVFNEMIAHINRRVVFGKKLGQYDLTKYKITQMASRLYALESMTYMTAGIADVQQTPDFALESALTKLYALETVKIFHGHCKTILGNRAFSRDEPFHEIFNDLHALELWEGSEDVLKMEVALQGIIHVGQSIHKDVKKWRNPLTFPAQAIRKMIADRHQEKDRMHFPLRLQEHVHPSLESQAKLTEYSTLRLKFGVERALMHHGIEANVMEIDMMRLTETATDVYAMACALSRANRTYCQGHAHCELDLELSFAIAYEGQERVKHNIGTLVKGLYSNSDFFVKKVADHMTEQGGYTQPHPVTRNVF